MGRGRETWGAGGDGMIAAMYMRCPLHDVREFEEAAVLL